MDIVEFVEKVLDTLRDMDNGIDVICNLDAKAVVERMKVVDIIPIPDGATNGEMLKIMFPDLKVEIEGTHITCWIDEHRWFAPDYDWWNAPYKAESEEQQ